MNKFSRKKTTENEETHSMWISLSDLMAGLIFIFLIILTVFSIQYKKEQNEFIAAKAELQRPAKTRLQILDDLKKMLKSNGLEVETLPEEGILRLTEKTLSFPAAKAFPNEENLGNLGKVAKALMQVLPCYSDGENKNSLSSDQNPEWCKPLSDKQTYTCKSEFTGSIETVMVEGHTDSMAVKARAGYRDNLSLSAARATTVLRLLKLCDSKLDDLTNKNNQPLVGASGYSHFRPVIRNNTRDPRNRRIDIRLMMDLPNNALEKTKKTLSDVSFERAIKTANRD